MGRMDHADLFEAATADRDDVLEHFEEHAYEGRTYRALPDARHGLERGTVLVGGAAIRGYPSIPRTLVLDPGIPRHFEGREVVVEEKLNGYNVRVVRVDGEVLAFTRGGYVCPFTTERARTLLDPDGFFDDHPRKALCAEAIGPESPYTDCDYPSVDSLAFRVFDVRGWDGEPLPVGERRDLVERYGFDQPTRFGRYDPADAPEAVESIVRGLAERDREGVVVRSADGERLLKYTTGTQHRAELAYAFSLPFDYGRDFVFSRIVREAFQSVEFEEDEAERRERARALGEAVLLPAIEAVCDVRDGETVGEEHTVRGDPDAIEALFDHLRDCGMDLDVAADRREDGERVVTFTKVATSTRDRTRAYLEGTTIDE